MRPRYSSSVPVRLHVLLARGAARGLLLHDMGKWVCTIGWDRTNDSFELGQCLKGQIHRYLCDLSPNGEHFIYAASSHRFHDYNPPHERPLYWTAISRAPYLKAIGFWPKSSGGIFLDNQTFHLTRYEPNEDEFWPSNLVYEPNAPIQKAFERKEFDYGLSYNQAVRNGWTIKTPCDEKHLIGIMEKKQATWTLRRFSRYGKNPRMGSSSHFWEWYNIHNAHGETLGGHEWEWADFDGDRVVWTQRSRLFAMDIWKDGRGEIVQLADFSNCNPQMVCAPY